MVDDFSKHDDKILFAKRIDMLEDSEFREDLKSKTGCLVDEYFGGNSTNSNGLHQTLI